MSELVLETRALVKRFEDGPQVLEILHGIDMQVARLREKLRDHSDAPAVLLTVRIAQGWKPGSVFPVAQLTDEGGFAGIDGAFRFRRDGIAERALEVQQVDAGRFSVIEPAPKGFGK